jgi:hypothetical protein
MQAADDPVHHSGQMLGTDQAMAGTLQQIPRGIEALVEDAPECRDEQGPRGARRSGGCARQQINHGAAGAGENGVEFEHRLIGDG